MGERYGKLVSSIPGESGETLEYPSIVSPFFLFVVLILQYRIHISLSSFLITLYQLGMSLCLAIWVILKV